MYLKKKWTQQKNHAKRAALLLAKYKKRTSQNRGIRARTTSQQS